MAEEITRRGLFQGLPGGPHLTDADRERIARAYAVAEVGGYLPTEAETDLERAARVRLRMEEDALRDEVIRVLRAQGYTVIPPGGQA
jgi:hypothetical protein